MAHRDVDTTWDNDFVREHDQGEPADWHSGGFLPGERIGALPVGRARSAARQVLSAAVILAAGWAGFETHATWRPWLAMSLVKIRNDVVRAHQSAQPPAAAALPTPVEPLGAAKVVAEVTGTTSFPPQFPPAGVPPEANITTASIDPKAADPAAAAPLPEPEVDPTDPQQKRAAAVGLHPRLSTVVLASLSATDYRNAAIAIRKALAEAADTDKFVWPRETDKKLAMFQVHFVVGAAATCRRYIVTIVKNGWTTTAPPMEKCGVKAAANLRDGGRTPPALMSATNRN